MLRLSILLSLSILVAMATACNSGRHSSAGFRLPDGGDVEKGKAAFVALQCHTCHKVEGVELPQPTAQPPVPVTLGGQVTEVMTDGYLVTSIINPSYELALYPKEQITVNGKSRMPDYADKITARQLTDVVAFLQSHYSVRRIPNKYTY